MAQGQEMQLIDGSAAPRPAEPVHAIDIDGDLLLLDPRTDGVHHLDRLGAVIWSVLDGEATIDELVADLADAFETPADVVRQDLDELLLSLRRIGALEGFDPPASSLVHEHHDHVHDHDHADEAPAEEGLWRPTYVVNPPAP